VSAIARLPRRQVDPELIAAYDAHTPWMWKDPRLCFTLAYWWRLLPTGSTGVVLVHRDPRAMYRSLVRTGWAEDGDGDRKLDLDQLAEHFATARATVRRVGIPHVAVDHTEYFTRLDQVCDTLAALPGTPISPDLVPVRRELDHSTFRERCLGCLLHSAQHGALRPLKGLRGAVPDHLRRLVFPDRR
jgi:hypothetical protein